MSSRRIHNKKILKFYEFSLDFTPPLSLVLDSLAVKYLISHKLNIKNVIIEVLGNRPFSLSMYDCSWKKSDTTFLNNLGVKKLECTHTKDENKIDEYKCIKFHASHGNPKKHIFILNDKSICFRISTLKYTPVLFFQNTALRFSKIPEITRAKVENNIQKKDNKILSGEENDNLIKVKKRRAKNPNPLSVLKPKKKKL